MIAIILASGKSERMKKNKLLIDFFNKPLIEWVIKTVNDISFNDVLIIYKDEKVKEISDKYRIKSVYNPRYKYGQSESIKMGLNNLLKEDDGYMFFTGDQPLLSKESIETLMQTFVKNGGIIVPKVNGSNRSPVIFSNDFKEQLLKLNGDVGGREIIKNNHNKVTYVDFDSDLEFFDIDTKEDLDRLKNWYGGEKI